MANVITKQQLVEAGWDAEVLGHFMNDPADTPNAPYPDGTLFTRTGLLLYNLARLRQDLGAGYLPDPTLASGLFLTNNGVSANWEAIIYELRGMDTTAPVSGTPFVNGEFYYNTSDTNLYQYNAGVWALWGKPKKGRDYWFDGVTYRWDGTTLVVKDSKAFEGVWPRPKIISNNDGISTDETLYSKIIGCVLNPVDSFVLAEGQLGFDSENLVLKIGNGVLPWDELTLSITTADTYGCILFSTVGTFTWTVPERVTSVRVTICGGGGGAGYRPTGSSQYAVGNVGYYHYLTKVDVVPKSDIVITVGGGGYNILSYNYGGNGGNSYFGAFGAGGGAGTRNVDSATINQLNSVILAKLGLSAGQGGYHVGSNTANNVPGQPGAVFVEWGFEIF